MDPVFFRKADPDLEATSFANAGCTSSFVATRESAAKDHRYDINGMFGTMCRHGSMEDVFGEIASTV